ncbi:methylated-DNA--[protein]-cysteine S-methyltransferase [Epidermidibacterium keratini]|uniref:Methylated-DNA--protein-cysteine methyltransferase n=1 Tax=Epidermidibacterium keratini TaxID=1891644 RepID=A0A7L4YNU2_9ACTN|nr:methylated-DNA--[protein]-cysteine S-methyltransferase [Epidermidibacterium keratini]QHC00217.1 methylated-DNA--[protein]-cysteine S-methyltransferase [Epidermidibacterium keratini]
MNTIETRLRAGGDIQALRERLAAEAASEGLLEVAYRELDSPIGRLLVASTPTGVVRVAFAREGFDDVLGELAGRVSARVLHAPGVLDAVAGEIDAYFAGDRERFDVPLDWQLASGFRRTVVEYLPQIGYGHTASYGDIASAVGNPKAVRAVGTACALNPLPLLVPCHRVVRSDGQLGQYRGGPEAKAALLTLEHAR